MRKLVMVSAVALSLGLGGCATTGGTGGSGEDAVQRVIQAVAAQCSFVPTVATAGALIANFTANGAVQLTVAVITQIATAVCDAVTRPRAMAQPGGAKPVVNGVVINGSFVRR
jgi:hypothetical protein